MIFHSMCANNYVLTEGEIPFCPNPQHLVIQNNTLHIVYVVVMYYSHIPPSYLKSYTI